MPSIGQIMSSCLYVTIIEQVYDAIDQSDCWWNCLHFRRLEQLCDTSDWSGRWYLLVFDKPVAAMRCQWSVRLLIFACMLQVRSNYSMPLVGRSLILACNLQVWSNYAMPLNVQIIDTCLHVTNLERFCDAIDRSDCGYLLVLYKSGAMNPMPLICQFIDICVYFTSLEQLCDTTDRWDCLWLLVFWKSAAIMRCHWSVQVCLPR